MIFQEANYFQLEGLVGLLKEQTQFELDRQLEKQKQTRTAFFTQKEFYSLLNTAVPSPDFRIQVDSLMCAVF